MCAMEMDVCRARCMQTIWKYVSERPGINRSRTVFITTDFRALFDVKIEIVRVDLVDELQLHEIADACPEGRPRDRIGETGNRLPCRGWPEQPFTHKDPYPRPATRFVGLWARQTTQLIYQINSPF